jgi:hypothetical protein
MIIWWMVLWGIQADANRCGRMDVFFPEPSWVKTVLTFLCVFLFH